MTDENIGDKYPHWREALFGNHNAVANIRCAVHYVFWHLTFALVAVVGVVFVGTIKLGLKLAPYFGRASPYIESAFVRVNGALNRIVNHAWAPKVGRVVIIASVVWIALLFVGGFVYYLYTAFWITIGITAATMSGLALLLFVILMYEHLGDPTARAANKVAMRARTAGERATETPGVRRVYGECPVSMGQAPKWFDNIFPEDDEL